MRQAGDAHVAEGTVPPRDEIAASFLMDETERRRGPRRARHRRARRAPAIAELAGRLVQAARANRHKHGGIDAFMHEYGLTSEEGIILMCLAEALLRIPDKDTADALIAEKIARGAGRSTSAPPTACSSMPRPSA